MTAVPNDKNSEYYEFENDFSFSNLFSWSILKKSFTKENIIRFFYQMKRPLHKREGGYWLIFSISSIIFTGMILNFIDQYNQDLVKYQMELTSIGKYNEV